MRKRVFHVGLRALDVVGAQLLRQKRHQGCRASSSATRDSERPPHRDSRPPRRSSWRRSRAPSGEVEPCGVTRRGNELARRLFPADVAGDPRVEPFVALEGDAVERAHVRRVVDRRGGADVVAVAQPAAEDVVAARAEVPVPEAGHVGHQDLARDVAARDEQARRDPRLAAGPARHRRWIQQMLAHRDRRLVEVGHPRHGVDAQVLHHRDQVLDRPLDVAAVARLAVEVPREKMAVNSGLTS